MPEKCPQVVKEFLAQSRTALARLDVDVAALGNEKREPGVVERVEGALRSIRSGASMLELGDVERAATWAEEMLNNIRAETGEIDRAGLDALAGAVGVVREQMGRFEAGRLMAVADELIRAAGAAVVGGPGGVEKAPEVDPCAASAAERVERFTCGNAEEVDEGMIEPARPEGVLERLGEVVAQSNRVAAMAGRIPEEGADPIAMTRDVVGVAGHLRRATEEMKDAVLGSRTATLAGVLAECCTAVANVAGRTGLDMPCEVRGGEVEVDSAVAEELRGVLLAAAGELAWRAAGPCGMTISARAEGWHVRIVVERDGLTARAGAAELAEARDAVEAMGGSMDFTQAPSGAETVVVRVPGNPAFLDAMVVRIGDTLCAIPSAQVEEVIRPEPGQVTMVRGVRVVRLTNAAVRLVDGRAVFGASGDTGKENLAVVVRAGGSRIAMGVDRALGRQEIVVRPLDSTLRRVGPMRCGGAAGDGSAVVVMDVSALVWGIAGAEERAAA